MNRGMTLQEAAERLGGEVWRNNVLCPGPGHSRGDRSLSVSFPAGGDFMVHSFAQDDFRECRDHVSDLLQLARPTRVGSQPASPRDTLDATTFALKTWRETEPLPGTPGAIHLERRGVSYSGDALRWHPSCPFGKGVRHGCMVALVRNIITNEPQAVHRTAIDAAGNKVDRKALGPIGGGVVKLSEDASVTTVLGIGEGIETTLSIRELPDLESMPVWAALTANAVASFPALPGIEAVWIAQDHDLSGAGQRAAQEAGRRLHGANIEVIIIAPTRAGEDINDKVARHA